MLVSANALAGTIGGGQLEWMAAQKARQILADGTDQQGMDIALGPEIGQCCGGRVQLSITRLTPSRFAHWQGVIAKGDAGEPSVFVFGAGHTGRALCNALSVLPFRTVLVDSRPETLGDLPPNVAAIATPLPERIVREAPARSAFVAMTHAHDLDFLITAEALKRGDAAYCGMIGSATKRAVFLSWLQSNAMDKTLAQDLVLPIGGKLVRDKRPQVIAAMTAAEILLAFQREPAAGIVQDPA